MNGERRAGNTDILTEIQVSVARVEEGVSHLVKMHETTEKRLNSHAGDIKSLNVSRARAKGIGAAIAGMTTAVLGLVGWYDS